MRRSWEMARSRLARIFSFSLSERIFSCSLTLVVRALVERATVNMTRAEKTLSGREKLKAK